MVLIEIEKFSTMIVNQKISKIYGKQGNRIHIHRSLFI